MTSCLLRSLVALLVLGACLWGAASYSLVRSPQGFHMLRKPKLTFADTFLDTRDWSLLDYARHADVSRELARLRLQDLRTAFGDFWKGMEDDAEAFLQGMSENARTKFTREAREIRNRVEKSMEDLQKQWNDHAIDGAEFSRRMEALEKRARAEFAALRQKFRQ